MKDGFYVEVKPTDPLSKVRRLFREYSPRIALVTGEKGNLIGIIYRSTIISVTSIKTNYVARNLVERPLLVAEKQSNVKSLLREMVYRDEWTIPLVDGYTPLGTVSLESFVKWINKNEI
ncbi:MAG: CBS domain-containing protein [Desulfurococcales archaeon]|nr:CBS domain-containing protein [Desulfurococcales archaeon]